MRRFESGRSIKSSIHKFIQFGMCPMWKIYFAGVVSVRLESIQLSFHSREFATWVFFQQSQNLIYQSFKVQALQNVFDASRITLAKFTSLK